MPKKGEIKDLTGKRFGKLVCLRYIGIDKNTIEEAVAIPYPLRGKCKWD